MTIGWIQIGIVEDNRDPERRQRVRVRLRGVSDQLQTAWARLLSPWGGKQRGWVLLPEPGDEVVVALTSGQVDEPVILGALHGKDRAPYRNQDGANDIRKFRSRSGHDVQMADGEGAESIELHDKNGQIIKIDSPNNKITIRTGGAVEFAGRRIRMRARGIVLQAQVIQVGANKRVVLSGGKSVGVQAGVEISGSGADVGTET